MSLKLILPLESRELIIYFSTFNLFKISFNLQTQRFKTEDEKPQQKVHHTENQNRRSDSPTKLVTVSFCFK